MSPSVNLSLVCTRELKNSASTIKYGLWLSTFILGISSLLIVAFTCQNPGEMMSKGRLVVSYMLSSRASIYMSVSLIVIVLSVPRLQLAKAGTQIALLVFNQIPLIWSVYFQWFFLTRTEWCWTQSHWFIQQIFRSFLLWTCRAHLCRINKRNRFLFSKSQVYCGGGRNCTYKKKSVTIHVYGSSEGERGALRQ